MVIKEARVDVNPLVTLDGKFAHSSHQVRDAILWRGNTLLGSLTRCWHCGCCKTTASGQPSKWAVSGQPSEWAVSGQPSKWAVSGQSSKQSVIGLSSHEIRRDITGKCKKENSPGILITYYAKQQENRPCKNRSCWHSGSCCYCSTGVCVDVLVCRCKCIGVKTCTYMHACVYVCECACVPTNRWCCVSYWPIRKIAWREHCFLCLW